MLILGIETSCDETGLALYDSERGLLGDVLHSQIAHHAEYGGVVPELASRDHIQHITPLFKQLLNQTKCQLSQIDCLAYTAGPGLAGALLVGAAFAQSLAFALKKPVLPIHHLEGHLLSALMNQNALDFPFLALLVSGGHTQLMRINGVGQYHILGETLDDAAGEAFDKTAKLLGLPYPGGALLSKMAENGKDDVFKLPRPMLHSGDLNFSFSGLKTAVLTKIKENQTITNELKANLARAFEEAITDVLLNKTFKALEQEKLKNVVVAGGVGANTRLRFKLNQKAKEKHFQVYYPPISLCTDNGVMIAFAAYLRIKNGFLPQNAGSFNVFPRFQLGEDFPRSTAKKF